MELIVFLTNRWRVTVLKMRILKRFQTMLNDMFHAVLKLSLLVKGMFKTTNAFFHQQFGIKQNGTIFFDTEKVLCSLKKRFEDKQALGFKSFTSSQYK